MIRQTWFVTGAASRLGADIVRQALAAGHQVVATDADPLAALRRVGNVADERLLALPLDEVDAYEVGVAVHAAVARFGGSTCWCTAPPPAARRTSSRSARRATSAPRCARCST